MFEFGVGFHDCGYAKYYYQRMSDLFVEMPDGHAALSACHLMAEDWASAEAAAGKAVRADETDFAGWFNLGMARYYQKDFKGASIAFERALQCDSARQIERMFTSPALRELTSMVPLSAEQWAQRIGGAAAMARQLNQWSKAGKFVDSSSKIKCFLF